MAGIDGATHLLAQALGVEMSDWRADDGSILWADLSEERGHSGGSGAVIRLAEQLVNGPLGYDVLSLDQQNFQHLIAALEITRSPPPQ